MEPVEVIAILLDGEYYVNRMNTVETLCKMQSSGDIPSTSCAFVSHVDGATRHDDLTCSKEYADFLVYDVLPWLKGRHRISEGAKYLIGGVSLSGLQAAYTSFIHSGNFDFCLCQSASFWWNEEWLTRQINNADVLGIRYWCSVGDLELDKGVSHPPTGLRQEFTQIDACIRFYEELCNNNIHVFYNLYSGGHELAPWEEEFPRALKWLFRVSKTKMPNKSR